MSRNLEFWGLALFILGTGALWACYVDRGAWFGLAQWVAYAQPIGIAAAILGCFGDARKPGS